MIKKKKKIKNWLNKSGGEIKADNNIHRKKMIFLLKHKSYPVQILL